MTAAEVLIFATCGFLIGEGVRVFWRWVHGDDDDDDDDPPAPPAPAMTTAQHRRHLRLVLGAGDAP
jgi:hypothetical protein